MVSRRPRLRTKQSHLTALKYPPQSRSPTISTDSSPLQSWETRLVSREIKRKSLTSAVTFTTDQVTKGISSCSNTRAFGPDKLNIFHLKHLGSRGIDYLSALFNDSVTSCRIPSIWKSSQSRNQERTPLSALLISISRSSSSENYGGSLTSNRQQPPATISSPTRFPIRTLYHFCFATTDE